MPDAAKAAMDCKSMDKGAFDAGGLQIHPNERERHGGVKKLRSQGVKTIVWSQWEARWKPVSISLHSLLERGWG